MPYLLSTCLDRFLESITVTGNAKAAAKTRRDGVTQLLEKRLALLDSFATGSLVRGTGLRNVSDVDVMVVLHYTKHLKDKTPKQALELVRTALSEYNAKIVKKNGQAVTLYFETWPNVDIVPCKRVGTDDRYVLHIPDMNTGEWILTDPGTMTGRWQRRPLGAVSWFAWSKPGIARIRTTSNRSTSNKLLFSYGLTKTTRTRVRGHGS